MQQNPPRTASIELTVLEAIAKRLLLRAEYNGQGYHLAPHHLFERHGDLFIGALNVDKAWRSDHERRLGIFKLKGLAQVELTGTAFDPIVVAEDALPRETDKLVFAV
jgi:hypothetical protein